MRRTIRPQSCAPFLAPHIPMKLIFFFAKRSPLGPVRDRPYVLFVEAKKDDFDAGWGQCLAAEWINNHG